MRLWHLTRSLKALLMCIRLIAGGKGASSFNNQSAEKICQPGHRSEGLWGIISYVAFVVFTLYYLLTNTSTKLPFIIEWSGSSEIFRFWWSWENKECVLSCSIALSKLWPSQNCSNYSVILYTVNTWKPRQANICFGFYLLHSPLIFPQEITM